ncbi:sensor histidine kinase [Xenophilus sp. AP218F]|nr:histidine kinase [Chromobacterium sp. ASV5]OWY40319.1 sensor histidine kinase [Xenophilus sp. AP218F]
MHPLLADADRLPWYAAAWLALGVLMAALLRWAGLATPGAALVFSLPLCLLYGFVALSAFYLSRAMALGARSLGGVIPAYASASLLCAALWLLAAEAWNHAAADGLVRWSDGARAALLAAGFGLYLLSLLAHDAAYAWWRAREAERREAASRLLAREAELALLRLQINPHFLFNSLNSISALTSLDPAAARDMAIELAQFFRRTLTLAERDRIPLGEELALCADFLAIEQRRFGSKLSFGIEADAAARRGLLPAMLLQPLVENAVKHGIYGLDGPGRIDIRAQARDGWLHIEVENPTPGQAQPRAGQGVGLGNVAARLAAAHGERARLQIRRGDGVFLAALALPLEET